MKRSGIGKRVREQINTNWLKQFVTSVLVAGCVVGILVVGAMTAGIVNTIIYTIIFLAAFFALPSIIGLMGRSAPGNATIGKLHFILGQVSAGCGYLVQLPDRYELCIGDRDKVLIEDEWYEIDGGRENMTILGWRPFGLIWVKDETQLRQARVDPKAEVSLGTDGGTRGVERAGIEEAHPDARVSGDRGTWLVDLKRLYSRGLGKVGNLDLLEQSEEQAMRDEVGGSVASNWSKIIGALGGLAMGGIFGLLYFGL